MLSGRHRVLLVQIAGPLVGQRILKAGRGFLLVAIGGTNVEPLLALGVPMPSSVPPALP
jgi:hypothetical protein